jgi:hypothetical protein
MFETASAAWREVRAAYGTRWYALGLTIAALVGWYDRLSGMLGMTEFIGIPNWMAGVLIFAGWTTVTAILHAVKLRKVITPNFAVSYPEALGTVEALERVVVQGPSDSPVTVGEYPANYVRVQIETTAPVVASGCLAFLTGLRFHPFGETAFGDIRLPQPVPLRDEPFNVYPGIPCLVDFVKATRTRVGDKLLVVRNWPLALSDRLDPEGVYEFSITVHGPGGTRQQVVEIDWRGAFDTIAARNGQEPNAPRQIPQP